MSVKTRFDCDIAGFEACYVEFSLRWSRGEVRSFWGDSEGTATLGLMRSKIAAMRLALTDGTTLTDPALIGEETLDLLDWELFQWFNSALVVFVQEMSRLGELTRRRLSATIGRTTDAGSVTSPTP